MSIVIIFKDEERFLQEAIDSVLAQTYDDWELLLVDDGSTDASTGIARRAAAAHGTAGSGAGRVRYLEHEGHANRGMSASRNLGIRNARGRYIASLDGDDVWRPGKLEAQVADLDRNPSAAMVYSPLLRWRTWANDREGAGDRDREGDRDRDRAGGGGGGGDRAGGTRHDDLMGVGRRKFGSHPLAGRVVEPPTLVRMMLKDDYFIPGGALIRRRVLDEVGLYEERFRGMYEDAVVMFKIALTHPVLVGRDVLYLYRMHPRSHTNMTSGSAEIDRARSDYLDWIEDHFDQKGVSSPALRRDLRRARRSTHARRQRRYRLLAAARAIGRSTMPRRWRDELRRIWRDRTKPTVAGR